MVFKWNQVVCNIWGLVFVAQNIFSEIHPSVVVSILYSFLSLNYGSPWYRYASLFKHLPIEGYEGYLSCFHLNKTEDFFAGFYVNISLFFRDKCLRVHLLHHHLLKKLSFQWTVFASLKKSFRHICVGLFLSSLAGPLILVSVLPILWYPL